MGELAFLRPLQTVQAGDRMGDDLTGDIHDLDVTVWVGKDGIGAVVDELAGQLEDRELVKVRFLRSTQSGTDVEELAAELGERVDGQVVDVRGHTAVFRA